jgi:hypothetical protein
LGSQQCEDFIEDDLDRIDFKSQRHQLLIPQNLLQFPAHENVMYWTLKTVSAGADDSKSGFYGAQFSMI